MAMPTITTSRNGDTRERALSASSAATIGTPTIQSDCNWRKASSTRATPTPRMIPLVTFLGTASPARRARPE